jgi:soluble lytic murein transglycosylase-like protein
MMWIERLRMFGKLQRWSTVLAIALVVGSLFTSDPVRAAGKPSIEAYRDCVSTAAESFELSPLMIELIIETEGGWPGARMRNKDNSYDLGVMQINTRWLPFFAERGLSESDLQNNACLNIYAGTYLLKKHLKQTGDVALAMAYYHNRKPHFAAAYLARIQSVIDKRIERETRQRAVAAK